MSHFVRATCFVLILFGLWTRLCQDSSLGLEPILLCYLFILSSLWVILLFVLISVYVKCRSILINCVLWLSVSYIKYFHVKSCWCYLVFRVSISFRVKCYFVLLMVISINYCFVLYVILCDCCLVCSCAFITYYVYFIFYVIFFIHLGPVSLSSPFLSTAQTFPH